MNKTNYALISALYDTKGADLYNDVYFPIIKYEIVNQYYTQVDIEKYYDLEELQGIINTDFGIMIPLIVLRQAIRAIGTNSNGISLSVYENGKLFKIKKAWDISINVSIDNRSHELVTKFNALEQAYKNFLEIEGLSCENTFIDFYSDNTEEILTHLERGNGGAIIDEKYINLTRFLFWIKEHNAELYNIANDVFWGSIIAGFLKRSTADISIKSGDKVEYFLDSALVLAALDLDNVDNANYANELLDIIKKSGNYPKVHALTVREIKNILSSVEKEQGPRPNTAIEEAYHRRNLTPTKILQIKNNLTKLITDKEIIIFPSSETDLDNIELEYKNKHTVKDLETFRGKSNNNSLRDIHDVYLRDLILKKRKDIVSVEKVNAYFVSLNSDLIRYFNDLNKGKLPLLIHPAKIIINLWIHNSHCSFVKKNGLTEIMSRCFALNNTDIRRKLQLVAKYYKESNENYSVENYQAVYSALINRSAKAIHEVDLVIENEQKNIANKEELNKSHIEALVKIAVDEQLIRQQKNSELSNELAELSENIKKANDVITSSKQQKQIDDSTIQSLKNQFSIEKSQIQNTILNLESELNKQKELNNINEQINSTSQKLSQMETEKENSICLIKFYLIIGLEFVFFSGIILSLILLGNSYFNNENAINFKTYLLSNLLLIIGFFTSAIGFTVRTVQQLYVLSPKIKYDYVKSEQITHWIKKHPEYNELKEILKELKTRKEQLL